MKFLMSIFVILVSCQTNKEKIIENIKWDVLYITLNQNNLNENNLHVVNNFRGGRKIFSIYFYDNKILISKNEPNKDKGNYEFESINNENYLNIKTDNKYFNKKFKYELSNRDTTLKEFKSTIYELDLISDTIHIRLRRFTPLELIKN
jgi:hypothetical protein